MSDEQDGMAGDAAPRSGLHGRSLAGALVAILAAAILAWVWLFGSWPDDDAAPGARLSFTATAYCKGTTTAAGTAVRRGIAAADRHVLPPGSVVTLSTGDQEFDGVYTILDTGPAVQGRILDLYVWSCNEALAFGRRKITATILRLGWDPRDSAQSLTERLLHRRAARSHEAEDGSSVPGPGRIHSAPVPDDQIEPAQAAPAPDMETQAPLGTETATEEPPGGALEPR